MKMRVKTNSTVVRMTKRQKEKVKKQHLNRTKLNNTAL